MERPKRPPGPLRPVTPLRPSIFTRPSIGKPTEISNNKLWSTPSYSPSSLSPYLSRKDIKQDIEMEEPEEIEKMPKLLLKQGKKRKGVLIIPKKEKEN